MSGRSVPALLAASKTTLAQLCNQQPALQALSVLANSSIPASNSSFATQAAAEPSGRPARDDKQSGQSRQNRVRRGEYSRGGDRRGEPSSSEGGSSGGRGQGFRGDRAGGSGYGGIAAVPVQSGSKAVSDLALQNAPTKVFELIGDPRSGVADDTTHNPFGEVTVDMVHHQISNEVYWYKYEYNGDTFKETHRDARLSEHAKNLMYLLRAKDPARWSIEALADKFRIRKQRVLAILALKEMEAHAIEEGRLLSGPLSAYATPVYLEDLRLDPATGEPLEVSAEQKKRGAEEEGRPDSVVDIDTLISRGGGAGAVRFDDLGAMLLSTQDTARQLQLQLWSLLQRYSFDYSQLQAEVTAGLEAAENLAAALNASVAEAQAAKAKEGGDDKDKGEPVKAIDLTEVRDRVQRLLAAAQPLFQSEVVQSERALLAAAQQLRTLLADSTTPKQKLAAAVEAYLAFVPSKAGAAVGGAAPAPALLPLEAAGKVLRLALALPGAQRKALLEQLEQVRVQLNTAGVDLAALASNEHYSPPPLSDLPQAGLPLDVQGFEYFAPEVYQAVLGGLQEVQGALGAVVARARQLGSKGPSPSPPSLSPEDLLGLQRQAGAYQGLGHVMGRAMMGLGLQGSGGITKRPSKKELEGMLELLAEVDPSLPQRAQQVEAVMQLRAAGKEEAADALAQQMLGAAPPPRYSEEEALRECGGLALDEDAMEGPPPVFDRQKMEKLRRQAAAKYGRGSWPLVAAYLDVAAGGKVFHRGSGERNVVRLPSYPAFEGYSLNEMDGMEEGELSSLNRKVAEVQEAEMYDRFKDQLLFNLGVVGEGLADDATPPSQPNLRSEVSGRPMVVYSIDGAGTTQYPPMFVVDKNGRQRPLNEQERLFQQRRLPKSPLPYHIGRVTRPEEIQ